jgi:two-component system sensor histidine kinase YesM
MSQKDKLIHRLRKGTSFLYGKYKKLQYILNNKKIKTKIIYVYVLCVLVPVLVTNTIIIGNMLNISKKEKKENINRIADTVANEIYLTLESAVYVTVDLYTSKSICNFLDTQYKKQEDYYNEYSKVFNNYSFYATSKQLISDITFFSDNTTMINGGKYYSVDSIKNDEWYQQYLNRDSDLLICSYYNDTLYEQQKKRMLTVIRKLNFIGMKDNEKIVKLDLNYNQINDSLNNSSFDTTVYVCHGDKIIFSNDENDKGLKADFEDISMINQKEIQKHKNLTAYGYDLDIYVTGYKSNYFSIIKDNLWLVGALFLADAFIPAIMLSLFSNSITKRILLLGRYLKKVKEEDFELITGIDDRDEIGELLNNYNLMTSRMKNLIEYEYKSKLEQQELHLAKKQAELLALYSQINPHFMFNVLESIRMHSIIKGEQETSQMIESLAKLMRKSAEWGADCITLKQELGFTEDYLKLQKYRYGDGFTYKLKIKEACYSYKVPSLVLVTFVENSCVHGLDRDGHYGTVFVSAYEENNYFYMEIEDTGSGMDEEQVHKLEKLLNEASINDLQKSVELGMLNASIRLKKYCGEQTKILIESEQQGGTCIIIKIPIENMRYN